MDWDDGNIHAKPARHDNDGDLVIDTIHILHVSALLLLDTSRT